MDLHTPTMLWLIVMISLLLAISLGVVAQRQQAELVLYAGAMALHALAYALLARRGQLGDFWTVGVANLSLSACLAVLAEAVYRFQRRPPPRWRIWAPVVLVTLLALGLPALAPARLIGAATLLAVQTALLLLALWQQRRQTPGRGPYLLAVALILSVLIALNRTRPMLAGSEDLQTQLFSPHHGQPLGFAAVLGVLVLFALGMLSMVQSRAEAALQASRAYEQFRSGLLERLADGQPLSVVLTAFALGVERLLPGCWCHVVLRPASGGALLGPVAAAALPGGAGWAVRVSEGEDEDAALATAFRHQAGRCAAARCRCLPVRASDRRRVGTLIVACGDDAAAALQPACDDLSRLAGLIIERCADAQRVRDSERQCRELIESANEGICVLQDGVLRYANPKVREMTGHTAAELLGRPFIEFVHTDDHALVQRAHERRLHGQADSRRYPVRVMTRQQGVRWFEVSGVSLDWQGRPATLNFLTDITERKQEDDLVHELAYHDVLTGLANRRLLLDHLVLALAGNRRNGRHGALLFIDLDHLKPPNDQHGHHVGDLLLVEVSRRLRHCVRELDTVARFGGDEFVVLLNGLASAADDAGQQASLVAEKVCHTLAEPYLLATAPEGRPERLVQHCCTCSVGVLLFAGAAESAAAAEALLGHADAAMYRAKVAGGNRVCFVEQQGLEPPAGASAVGGGGVISPA